MTTIFAIVLGCSARAPGPTRELTEGRQTFMVPRNVATPVDDTSPSTPRDPPTGNPDPPATPPTSLPTSGQPGETTTTTSAPPGGQPGEATTTTTTTVPSGGQPTGTWQLQQSPNLIGGCPSYDRTSVFHSLVEGLPVHPRSDEWIQHIGTSDPVKPLVRSAVFDGTRPGYPINYIDSRVTGSVEVTYHQDQPRQSWLTPVPIPSSPRIEGDPTPGWDKHLLIVDSATCVAYELANYERAWYDILGIHWAVKGTAWQLGEGEALVPQSGVTVSGAPLIGTSLRLEEVRAGRIDHLIGACSDSTSSVATWPAQNADGTDASPSAIPIGTRLRLRDSVDTSVFTGQSAVIARALEEHGLMVQDTCFFPLGFFGENVVAGWDDNNLKQLNSLVVGDFEVVDVTPMIISEDSWQVR